MQEKITCASLIPSSRLVVKIVFLPYVAGKKLFQTRSNIVICPLLNFQFFLLSISTTGYVVSCSAKHVPVTSPT
jgi:hypothetical protein